MIQTLRTAQAAKRLVACLIGSVVLAMMVGSQEGSATDYAYEFRTTVLQPRIFVFLFIGIALFLAISFWGALTPYLARPGFWPLLSGGIAVVAAQGLMHWYDPLGDQKFGTVARAVANTPSLSWLTRAFFGWLAWTQLFVILVLGLVVVIRGIRWMAYVVAAACLFAAVVAYTSHQAVVDTANQADHSLGFAAAIVGYLVIAGAVLAAVLSASDVASTKRFVRTVLGFRPGFAVVAAGAVCCLLAVTVARWFSPSDKNWTLAQAHSAFSGQGLNTLADAFLGWLAYILFAVAAVIGLTAAWLRNRVLGWVAAIVGAAGAVLCLFSMYKMSQLAAQQNFDSATGPWQNLGTGGWLFTAGLFLCGAGGLVAATAPPEGAVRRRPAGGAASAGVLDAPGARRSLVMIAIAVALFYPPTATSGWQTIIVGEIGISMFLALGLNVVVGWAGLLDLGFIAFYAIGSYTTAYLVGALPVVPPHWLQMSPLLAIPFAVGICLIAGLALGAPTLRLRGDYLAIVTLGFGEIIHLIALNAQSVTNGSEGPPKPIPHPAIHLGPLHIVWGLNKLQYWYLLLVFMLIIVLLFQRLEHSRVGRAWAAIREDEVAAQATGINTTRTKLLAFAIGASTSGIAGVFNASLVGSFAPDNFLLTNSILIVAYVVFGGMGSITGAMAGAALLTWLPRFLQDQVPQADQTMWIGAVIVLMMIFRPAGLFPARRRAAELGGFDSPASSEVVAVPASEGL
jgi:ABC-type branched-subunit amino acid transport system permease subunit